jgi:Ni,Fe-hydrogenase III component G
MNRIEVLKNINERFKSDIVEVFDKSDKRVYIEIKKTALIPMANYIFKELKARFNIASGMDMRYHMEILYHFTLEDIDLVLSLRVKLPKDQPLEIDALAPSFKGADWIEREMHEMLESISKAIRI